MKVTKSYLKQIIKEEIEGLENGDYFDRYELTELNEIIGAIGERDDPELYEELVSSDNLSLLFRNKSAAGKFALNTEDRYRQDLMNDLKGKEIKDPEVITRDNRLEKRQGIFYNIIDIKNWIKDEGDIHKPSYKRHTVGS